MIWFGYKIGELFEKEGVALVSVAESLDTGERRLAISPDGQWTLFTRVDQFDSEIMLVENFR